MWEMGPAHCNREGGQMGGVWDSNGSDCEPRLLDSKFYVGGDCIYMMIDAVAALGVLGVLGFWTGGFRSWSGALLSSCR